MSPAEAKALAKRQIREVVHQIANPKTAKPKEEVSELLGELGEHFEWLRQVETRRGDWVAC